jgi:hypothetical protein
MFYLFFRPLSCVPNIACVSGMSILWFSLKLMFSVLCFVVVDFVANDVSMNCPFLNVPSVLSNGYLSRCM